MRRFRNILLVCDENSAYEPALERARGLAEANGAQVTVVDVIDAAPGELSRLFAALPGSRAHEVEDEVLSFHRARLDRLAEPLRAAGVPVDTKVLQGTAFLEVIRHVLRHGNDLVIKGAQSSPDRPLLRGPDLHLMRKSPCPVWILNARTEPCARRILAAVDPDPDDRIRDELNHRIMELATSLARSDGARLDVMNVWRVHEEATLRHGVGRMTETEIAAIIAREERGSAERLRRLVADFERFDDIMRVLHIKGVAADVIPAHVHDEGIDTVVMGTLARSGIAGLFIGNTAETILNRVASSVLAVKPKGFVSPVTLDGKDGN